MFSLFSIVMLLPAIMSLLTFHSSDEGETSDIHFLYQSADESVIKSTVAALLQEHDISDLTRVEYQPNERRGTVSLFFQSNTGYQDRIDALIIELKDHKQLLFSSENWQFNLPLVNHKIIHQLMAQFFALVIFSLVYLRSFKAQHSLISEPYPPSRVLLTTFFAVLLLVMVVQGLYLILDSIGLNFSELSQQFETSFEKGFWWLLTALIVAPILEELVFRGIIYKNFLLNHRPITGALFSSVLFASAHQAQFWQAATSVKAAHFLFMLIISLVFCWLYKKFAKLWVPMLAHASYNGVLLLIGTFKI